MKRTGKNMKNHLAGFILLLFLLVTGLSMNAMAGSTRSYTMSVGDTKTLKFSAGSKVINSASWYSNSMAVEVVSPGVTSCYIKVNSFIKSTVIVRCDYYYWLNGRLKSDYADFYITIRESGTSSGSGSYSLSADPSTVKLDLAGETNSQVTVKLTGALPENWDIRVDAGSNSCVSVGTTGKQADRVNLILFAEKTGSKKLTLELCDHVSSSKTIVRGKTTLSVKVTCSHAYDSGVITKEPSTVSKGTRTYTCRFCGDTKKESIPRLEDMEEEETEAEPEPDEGLNDKSDERYDNPDDEQDERYDDKLDEKPGRADIELEPPVENPDPVYTEYLPNNAADSCGELEME
ncbi:MAG: hypothetical protein Q4F76_10655 [Lachnospiraceae bacterium]|nr:hypothetical protein [Lachnospiraceae bacterium]